MLVTDERAGDTLHRFVGRRRELEALRTALADARGGCGGLVLVTGEAGIGKTRLVEEFACEVAAGGALVVWGRCREAAGASSYSPWVQLLRGWRAEAAEVFDAALGASASYVAQLLPELRAERPALPAPPISPDAEHGRFYLFEALAAFVRAGARQRPLVLVLDDVQWGDPDSLLLLEHVAARTREAATLLLATCRDPEGRPTPRVARLAGALSRIGRHLPLRGLDVDDVRRLLALHMPGGSVTGVLARLIHRRTEGNPFFVDETARVLAAEGGFARPELAADGMLPLPGGAREVLRRRLSPLPAPCIRALEVAAVMGREFDTVSLGRACGVAPEAVLEAIGPAAASGLVVRDGTTPGRFRFAHELIRETLYEELPAAERARLHGRVGEILETMHGARLEAQLATLAHHFLASASAVHAARGISYAARAARLAASTWAYADAACLFSLALAVPQRAGLAPDAADECDLLLGLGGAQWRAGDGFAARDSFRRAAAVARRLRDGVRLAQSALGFAGEASATLWVRTGIVDEAVVALLEEALDVLDPSEAALRARLLARLALELYFSPARVRAAELSATAVALARATGSPGVLATALLARCHAVWGPESVDERHAIAGEVLAIGERLGDRELVLLGHRVRLIALLDRGDVAAADREIEAWERGVAELHQPLYLALLGRWRAMRATLDGRFAEAERHALEALDHGRQAGEEDAEQFLVLQLGMIRLHAGDFSEAGVRAVADRYPGVPAWRCGLAYLLGEQGRAAEAQREIDRLGDVAGLPRDVHWLAATSFLSAACIRVGDTARAAALYDLLAPHASLVVQAGGAFACLGSVSLYLGDLAATLGRLDAAIRHFDEALATHRRMGAPPLIAAAAFACAEALDARGTAADGERAATLVAEARGIARELGLRALLARFDTDRAVPAARAAAPPPAVFRCEGDFWTIAWEGSALHLRDAKGLRYLAQLLRYPGQEFHALALAAAVEGPGDMVDEARSSWLGSDAGVVLDARAQQDYRARAAELRHEIEEAEQLGHPTGRLRAELETVMHELATARGLGGRARRLPCPAERARLSITKTIRAAVRTIRREHPALGSHLQRTVHTGTFFFYEPEGGAPAKWTL